jgi:hypothetical protein
VIGLDWGHLNWGLAVGVNTYNNLAYLIGFNVVEDSDTDPLGSARQMHAWAQAFEPDLILADSGYGKDRNAYMLKLWGDRFYAVYYHPSDKHSRTFKPQFIQASHRVLADRTITLKYACQQIREKALGLPAWDSRLQLVVDHFKNLAPLQVEEDDLIYEVIEHTGDDHLAHCVGYTAMGVDQLVEGWGNFGVTWE